MRCVLRSLAVMMLTMPVMPLSAHQDPVAPAFRSQANLVVLQVAVLDKRSMLVPGLTQHEFVIYEDGVRQEVQFFVSEDRPVAVGLVVDNSTSMMNKRAAVIAAADAFAKSSNVDDALFTLNFNERWWLGLPDSLPFTSDRAVLHDTLAGLQARGRTALYDGVSAALDHLVLSPLERHVLIVVSDGGDNGSQMELREIVDKVRRSNTVIYPVGVFDEFTGGDKRAFRALASASGGVAFFPRDDREARQVLERIAREIRLTYSLGYVPTNAKPDGTYRKIAVVAFDKLSRRPLAVRVREGYRAPSDPGGS
jgi:Ca-activated chloride channel homolog